MNNRYKRNLLILLVETEGILDTITCFLVFCKEDHISSFKGFK